MTAPWPAPVDVLPHRPPMVLLTRIVSHDRARTVCAVDITATTPFVGTRGYVDAWVGVEYMAQCVAAHAGLEARARGAEVRLGLLIGARRIDFNVDRFAVGHTVVVTATHVWGEREAASFECLLADGAASRPLARGGLSVYSPRDIGAVLGRS